MINMLHHHSAAQQNVVRKLHVRRHEAVIHLHPISNRITTCIHITKYTYALSVIVRKPYLTFSSPMLLIRTANSFSHFSSKLKTPSRSVRGSISHLPIPNITPSRLSLCALCVLHYLSSVFELPLSAWVRRVLSLASLSLESLSATPTLTHPFLSHHVEWIISTRASSCTPTICTVLYCLTKLPLTNPHTYSTFTFHILSHYFLFPNHRQLRKLLVYHPFPSLFFHLGIKIFPIISRIMYAFH